MGKSLSLVFTQIQIFLKILCEFSIGSNSSRYSTAEKPLPLAGGSQGGNANLWDEMFQVSVQVTNTGSVPGKVVTQL
jgi:hypothetical protein